MPDNDILIYDYSSASEETLKDMGELLICIQ